MAKRVKYVIGGLVVLVSIGGFAAFRPDKLLIDNKVNETLDPRVATALESAAAPPSTQPTSTTLPAPTVVSSGEWNSIEHETTGSVSIIADGPRSTLVMTDLATSNGPDLVVYLSPASPNFSGDYTDGALSLGALKGNIGTQSYAIPAGTNLADYGTVVIWCERFSVGFGVAGITPV